MLNRRTFNDANDVYEAGFVDTICTLTQDDDISELLENIEEIFCKHMWSLSIEQVSSSWQLAILKGLIYILTVNLFKAVNIILYLFMFSSNSGKKDSNLIVKWS